MGLDQAYQVLGISPSASLEELRILFDQMRLAYHQRASNPITPSDWSTKAKYQKIIQAYSLLKNRTPQTQPRILDLHHLLKIGVKDFLAILEEHGFLKLVIDSHKKCGCLKVCTRCRGSRDPDRCSYCQGSGWYHHCGTCSGSGLIRVESEHILQIFKIEPYLSWTILNGGVQTHVALALEPQQGVEIKEGKVWIHRGLDVKEYLSGDQIRIEILGKTHRVDIQTIDHFPYHLALKLDKPVGGLTQVWVQFTLTRARRPLTPNLDLTRTGV